MGFITSPYYQVSDNYQLVLNIANFLAGEARSRTLTDFPDLFTASNCPANQRHLL